MEYDEFIKGKVKKDMTYGFDIDDSDIHPLLFDFQREVVKWTVKKGRCAIFQDCGLGKTIQQLEWARHIHQKTNGKILILTPLAVAQQTVREGKKIDLKVNVCKRQSDAVDGINVTNYEKLHHFDPKEFVGVVADESGILKNFAGTVRKEIQAFADNIPYRLACSATPSPNDFMEIGTQSEFLGYMSRNEMLAEFFINDMKETQKWRLKKHAEGLFWEWMSMWCVAMQKPSDLGYEDRDFLLPELVVEYEILDVDNFEDSLAPCETLNDRRRARKKSLKKRVTRAAEIANNYDGPVLLWCDLNDESSMLADVINDSVEVAGKHTNEYKEKAMMDFSYGKIKAMISKSVIAGFGMNWQHCSRMIFVGLSDSYEQMYQAIRRCWRFGQKSKVYVTVIIGEMEVNVLHNIQRKEQAAQRMFRALIDCLNKHGMNRKMLDVVRYNPTEKMMLPNWL
jgi:superfamily II DNA or RNA helicase